MKISLQQYVYLQEDPQAALGVLCSVPSVTYNPGAASTVTFSIMMVEGLETAAPESVYRVYLQQNGVANLYTWGNGILCEGVRLGLSIGAGALSVTLTISQGATADGVMWFVLNYKGKRLTMQVPLTRVADGDPGARGAIIRGPRLWTDVKTAHGAPNDTEYFYKGADGEPFADVVLVVRDANNKPCERFFIPKKTHLVHSSPHPITATNASEFWEQFTDTRLIATYLLLASKAKINNLFVDDVEILDNNNEPIFEAYKDAQGKGVVRATMGVFENAIVQGDIKANTQTFNTPPFSGEKDIHLWDSRDPEKVVQIEPQGGCLIIPNGKCSYEVVLPEVSANTARQITVINQKFHCYQPNGGLSWARRVYIKAANANVRIFKKPDDYNSISTEDGLVLPFGVYHLFGYKAEIPLSNNTPTHNTYTCWTLWKTYDSTFTPGSTNALGVSYPVNPYTIPRYNYGFHPGEDITGP